MAIIKPVIFTSVEDAEVTRNRPVAEETVRKLIQNANMLGALAAIGSIRCVQINMIGGGAPDSDQWQLCDGGEITHANSPLATSGFTNRYTPNFQNTYIRGANNTTSNPPGGSSTVNLQHNHSIGTVASSQIADEKRLFVPSDTDAYQPANHNHGINNDLSSGEPLDPAHQQVGVYLKIN